MQWQLGGICNYPQRQKNFQISEDFACKQVFACLYLNYEKDG